MSRFFAAAFFCLTFLLPAGAADFNYPRGIVAKADGTIFVCDRFLPGIWKVKDGKAEVYFKGSKKFREVMNAPFCVAIDHEGNLLAGDSATREVYRFGEDGKPKPLVGGKIGIPMSIAVAKDGTIYVADLEVHRIWKVPAAGGKPEEHAVINSPRGLALDKDERLWILSTSSKDGQIQRVKADGKLETVVAGRPFRLPHNIVVTDDGSAYVSDNYSGCVWKVTGGKAEKWSTGDPLKKPVGLGLHDGSILIADPHAKGIFKAAADGKLTSIVK